jgi:O-antigen ligase
MNEFIPRSKTEVTAKQSMFFSRAMPWVYFGFLFLILPFTFTPDTLDYILPIRMLITAMWLLLLLIMVVFSGDGQKIRIHPFAYGWGGFFLISMLSLTKAINISEGWIDLIEWMELGLTVWMGVIVLKQKQAVRLMCKLAILCGIGLSLSGIIQLIEPRFLIMPGGEMPYGTMSSKNLLASALFMLLPFIVYGFKYWKFLGGASIIIVLIGFWITQSRAVGLALLVTLLSSGLLLAYFHKELGIWEQLKLNLKKIARLSLVITLAFGTIGLVWFLSQDKIQMENSFRERKHLWEKTTHIIADQPILGVGAGNWKLHLPAEGMGDMMYYAQEGTTHYARPHNDFLWVWAETGILGLIGYLSLFILAFWLGVKMLKALETKHKILVLLLLSVLAGYLVIANVSFPKERIFHQLCLGVYAAILIVLFPFGKEVYHSLVSKAVQVISFVILIGLIVVCYSRFQSDQLARQAVDLREKNPQKAIQLIDRAKTGFYTLDPAVTPLYFYRGTANFSLQKTDEAFKDFKKAEQTHPNHMHVLNNLGTCYELRKNHEKAIAYYQKALHISPGFDDARINLGAAYFNKGDYQSALKTLKQVQSKDQRLQPYLKAVRTKLKKN